mgnify:CR=1 FL=1
MNLHLDIPDKYPRLKYFVDNYDTLCKAYKNKFVVICDGRVTYSARTYWDAKEEAEYRKYKCYSIYECSGDPQNDIWGHVSPRCTLLPC